MFKKPILLNVMLLIVSGVLTYSVSQMWLSFSQPGEINGLVGEPQVAEASLDKEKKGKVELASLSSYNVIGEQNVFRPQRREWIPPPPKPPSPAKPVPAPKKKPEPLPPPPLPDPAVMGIILEEDGERIAIMQGHRREEIKVKSRRRGRSPSRIVADRVRTYHEGDAISEAIILEIQEDKVIIEREGEKIELALGNKGSVSTAPSSVRPSTKKRRSRPSPYSRPKASPERSQVEQPPASPPTGLSRSERLKKFRKSWRQRLRRGVLGAPDGNEEDVD